MLPPSGGPPLFCDRQPGHRGQHARTLIEDGEPHTYRWGPRSGSSGRSLAEDERRTGALKVRLAPDVLEQLAELAQGSTRTAVLEELVRREYALRGGD